MNKRKFFKLGTIAQLAKLVHRSPSTIYRWKRESVPRAAEYVVNKIEKTNKSKIRTNKTKRKDNTYKPKNTIDKTKKSSPEIQRKSLHTKKYKESFKKLKKEIVETVHLTKLEKEQQKEIRRLKRIIDLQKQKPVPHIIIPLTKRERAQRVEQLRLATEEQARLGNIKGAEDERRKRAKKAEEEKLEKEEKKKQKQLDNEYGAGTVYREITVRRNIAIADRFDLLQKLKKPTKKQKEQIIILEGWLLDAALRLDYYETGAIEFYNDLHNIDDLHATYDEIFGY